MLSRCGLGAPARKHGVSDGDIQHAVRMAVRHVDLGEGLTMMIGPARDGRLLEVGVLGADSDRPAVIHAMALRPRFYEFL
jgi:hypothetical protein